ncbi:hypothetical protein [Thorsellia kenyensis]|uniref:Uncharacterized protein n=1 Tax=Thorsellia kenyensis TaxID=1549888 RepID=A0ABV6CAZ2_9GAMM
MNYLQKTLLSSFLMMTTTYSIFSYGDANNPVESHLVDKESNLTFTCQYEVRGRSNLNQLIKK